MLYYDRIGISEGIDFNKTSKSKGIDICHYWYFLHKGFQFQQNVCNRCHDLLMMRYCDIAIVLIIMALLAKLAKNEATNLMQNADLTKKGETLQNITTYKNG